jgi:sugar phosphate isomerase/epimerase
MKTIKGPAIFLAQYLGDKPPFHELGAISRWARDLGFVGLQIPTWDARAIDLDKAAQSKSYCDEYKGKLAQLGLSITELSTHLQGQLVAVHPAYDLLFDGFAAASVRGNPKARTEWAVTQVKNCLTACKNLGLSTMITFCGALAWPFFYSWPPRPPGLIDEAFKELGKRWKPILDHADSCGIDCAFEIHPGEDTHDGVTFERFRKATGEHKRAQIAYDPSHFVLQCLDYLGFIDVYHEFIKVFHVKDAEFNPTARSGVYGGYQDWIDRPGRFRSLGDGKTDFTGIFSRLARYDYPGWAVLEWECAIKDPEQGAREGAVFIRDHIIKVTEKTFDDFAGGKTDAKLVRGALGLS